MELLKANYLDTTTQVVVGSATDTVSYLFDRDVRFQYVTSGFNNDLTTASIRINFNETLQVSRIALLGHNLRDYTLFYNGATASLFALSTGGATTSSSFTSNSETSQYLRANPIFCTSVTLDMKKTITANAEKVMGFLVVGDTNIVFDRAPAAKNYQIKIDPTEVVHRLSDGGTRIQNVSDKYKVTLKYNYLSASTRDSLKSIWQLHREMVLCPFGTTTAWDKVIFPCVWEGDFEFYKFSDDAAGAGFEGKIVLSETPR